MLDTKSKNIWSYYARPNKQHSIDEILERMPPGWKRHMLTLFSDLEEIGWTKKVSDLRHISGCLEFYLYNTEKPDIATRVERAKKEAIRICYECGIPSTLRHMNNGHYLCEVHKTNDGYCNQLRPW